MIAALTQFVQKHSLLKQNDTIVVALSGGPDSVFLLHVLRILQQHYNLTLYAAHFNHEWRASAIIDQEFCAQLCQQLGIPFIVQHASTLPHFKPKETGSKEDLGRQMRRHFFTALAQEYNATIALGHHLDDQEENFFIRLIRGTSLTGLTGIKAKDGIYIRPLLEITKQNILDYLQLHALTYIIDPTNESDDYLRNRIRKQVMPALHTVDARFDANFLSTLTRLQEADQFINTIVQQTFATVVDQQQALNIQQFLQLSSFLQKRILLHWLIQANVKFNLSQALLEEIIKFLATPQSGQHTFATYIIEKKSGIARIKVL